MQSRSAGDSGQQLTVRFTNLYRYYLANSYLPSFLLVVISYSTFYFRLEDFNERIMVSITAMLVLVALFSQTSSTILKTTYLKLIDIWYMVCIVVDFVMVMMLALIDFVLHNHSSNRIMVMPSSKNGQSRYFPSKAEKLNKIGRVALPLLFLAFLLVYAIIACVKICHTVGPPVQRVSITCTNKGIKKKLLDSCTRFNPFLKTFELHYTYMEIIAHHYLYKGKYSIKSTPTNAMTRYHCDCNSSLALQLPALPQKYWRYTRISQHKRNFVSQQKPSSRWWWRLTQALTANHDTDYMRTNQNEALLVREPINFKDGKHVQMSYY
nr:uncharacterized protein LOC113811642 [Penaeus vannamei]